jgi:hypothetical protein
MEMEIDIVKECLNRWSDLVVVNGSFHCTIATKRALISMDISEYFSSDEELLFQVTRSLQSLFNIRYPESDKVVSSSRVSRDWELKMINISYHPSVSYYNQLARRSARLASVLLERDHYLVSDQKKFKISDVRVTVDEILRPRVDSEAIAIKCDNRLQFRAICNIVGFAEWGIYDTVMREMKEPHLVIYRKGILRPSVVRVSSSDGNGYEEISAVDLLDKVAERVQYCTEGLELYDDAGTKCNEDNTDDVKKEDIRMGKVCDLEVLKFDSKTGTTEKITLLSFKVDEFNHVRRVAKELAGASCTNVISIVESGSGIKVGESVEFKVVDQYAEGSEKHKKLEDLKALLVSTTANLVNSQYGSEDMEQYASDLRTYEEEWKRLNEEKKCNRYSLEVIDGSK